MNKTLITLAVIFVILLACSPKLSASDSSSCLLEAYPDLKANDSVKLVDNAGKVIEGNFISMDLVRSTLTLHRIGRINPDTSYHQSDISKIKYKKVKLRPAIMILGTGLGLYFGGMVASSGSEKGGVSFSKKDLTTISISAALGLVMGTILSLDAPMEVTVSCGP